MFLLYVNDDATVNSYDESSADKVVSNINELY